jgi:predicted alpha/beta superfamily hydrolase
MIFTSLRLRFALSFALLVPATLTAQDSIGVSWSTEIIQSAKLKEARSIYVSLPANYAASTERYPVMVILDANDRGAFPAAIANARFLTSRNAAPRMIFVGIPSTQNRTRDLTPSPVGKATQETAPTGGGGDSFADFIGDEVLPRIRSKYRTSSATFLAGHSYGGLFALYHAASRPGRFNGIIAMSPALWFNDSTVARTYADEIAKAGAPVRIFATSGGLEPAFDITTKRFVARMDSLKPANVAIAYRHYPDDGHNMTPLLSFAEGVRFIFEPIAIAKLPRLVVTPSDDDATITAKVTAIEQTYARGARQLGAPEVFPEAPLNIMGYQILNQARRPSIAVSVFRRNVERYPGSANTYDSLADGLLAMGDTAAAKVQLRRAIDVALRSNDGVLEASRTKLKDLETSTQAGRSRP